MDNTIYVQWSDDGQHIRKWSRGPFEGAVMFHQSETGAALTSDGREADVERVAVAIRDVKQGLGFDYIDFCRDAARAAIAALAQPVEAKCPKCWCREMAPLDDGSGSRCVNCKHVQPVEAGEDGT